MQRIPQSSATSRSIRRFDALLAQPASTAILGGALVAFFVVLAIVGFPESWEVAFSTVASAVTLVMVFALHHAQRREQATTHLKLDELIRAMPQADDHFVRLQAADDDELVELEDRNIEHHLAARRDDGTD
jgi:low affinity Fe/Cu permease